MSLSNHHVNAPNFSLLPYRLSKFNELKQELFSSSTPDPIFVQTFSIFKCIRALLVPSFVTSFSFLYILCIPISSNPSAPIPTCLMLFQVGSLKNSFHLVQTTSFVTCNLPVLSSTPSLFTRIFLQPPFASFQKDLLFSLDFIWSFKSYCFSLRTLFLLQQKDEKLGDPISPSFAKVWNWRKNLRYSDTASPTHPRQVDLGATSLRPNVLKELESSREWWTVPSVHHVYKESCMKRRTWKMVRARGGLQHCTPRLVGHLSLGRKRKKKGFMTRYIKWEIYHFTFKVSFYLPHIPEEYDIDFLQRL